jgi:hypothetical protein
MRRQAAIHQSPTAGPIYGALLHSPPLAAHLARMGTLVRTRGDDPESYSHADREWVDIVLSRLLDYYTVLPLHIPDALAVGVRLEAIEALWNGRDDELNDDEQLLTRYVRQVVSGEVTDASFDEMESRLGTRGIVDYTVWINHLLLLLRTMQAFGVPSPSAGEITDLVVGLREGRRTVPIDFRSRIR